MTIFPLPDRAEVREWKKIDRISVEINVQFLPECQMIL